MADEKFIDIASNAKQASKKLATLSTGIKNKALLAIAQAFENNTSVIAGCPFFCHDIFHMPVKKCNIAIQTFVIESIQGSG